MRLITSVLALFLVGTAIAQEKKTIEALLINTPLTIDGILDEPVYSTAKPAKDFLQLRPYNGKPSYQPSEVYFFYDQSAVYVGGMFYDSAPDSIFNFLSERDNIGMSDYFGVYLDPYNQGQLAHGFFITPAGVQTDIKAVKSGGGDNEDSNWDAVWQSKTNITDKGWAVEMRIPYSALRFPENGEGIWGLNMFRNIRRYNSNNSWNFVNNEVSGFIHQQGQLTGIQNIKPPVRLSLSPYAAGYAEFKTENSSPDYVFKGGMDLKYGISDAFTLDMMLIPDFGQIQSDDQQLNLSPYELYYSEKRQFFTEGTELFDRGGIFYSRRIGATPKFSDKASDELSDNEVVDYNPTETQLLNATKVSGRTSKGWGLGMLNAMSLPSYATLKDTLTGNKHDVLIQPFTNYNVAVIDKSMKNNSYISLINTNMWMADNPFRANVTATDFQIRNKAKTYALAGTVGVGTRKDTTQNTGYYMKLNLDKNSGKFQYGIGQTIISDKLNPNDMGYLQRNNEMITEAYLAYNILKPFAIFREVHATLWYDHNRNYKPNTVTGNRIGFNNYNLYKNNFQSQINFNISGTTYDFYEPRVAGRYFVEPFTFAWYLWGSSDSRKKLRLNLGYEGSRQPKTGRSYNGYSIYLNLRIGKRYQLYYSTYLENQKNDRGYVDSNVEVDTTIYFARRDVETIVNELGASYILNNKASISLRARHYWSSVTNREYYQLDNDGSLYTDAGYTENNNENYNAFNVDLIFRWIFAPGSELSVAWKNSIYNSKDEVVKNYFDNLQQTWKSDQTNTLSLKILYYIDYNNIRKKK